MKKRIRKPFFNDNVSYLFIVIILGSPENTSELNKEEEDQRLRSQSTGSQSNKTAAFASSEEDSAESSSDSEESGDERYLNMNNIYIHL